MNTTRVLRSLLIAALIAGLLFGAVYASVYLNSEHYLANVTVDEGFEFADDEDPAFIERGRHIARTRGCFGCHGQELEGLVFAEEWIWVGTAVAPNLASYAREHSPATIEAAVRQGIGHDGRALWSMPSYNFALMTDEDVSALIAFLRSAPVARSAALPQPDIGFDARYRIFRNEAQHMAEWADRMPGLTLGPLDDPQLVRGEYLAKTTCNECHGFDLRGQVDIDLVMPDLAVLAAYSDEDFRKLMKTGEATGGRTELRLMTMVAKDRFAYFTEQELDDLLAYLRTLPGQPVDHDASWRKLR